MSRVWRIVIHETQVADLLARQGAGLTVFDTRSPGEFAFGRVVGAASLPLFSDAERATVGTLYKQVDPRVALLTGLDIVGPKMRTLVETAAAQSGADFSEEVLAARAAAGLSPKPAVGVYCWRGGSRSSSVAWLLDTAGFDVYRLVGGYKAYRGYVRKQFGRMPFELRVVDGSTGSGKTVLLHELAKAGAQVLDLEGIAKHKGSAFGLTPGDVQPSTEQAENEIYATLAGFDESRPVWVENESRNVGKVFLPEGLTEAMAAAKRYEIVVPREDRLAHIVEQYGRYPRAQLADTFHHLRKRLGLEAAQRAISAVDAGDLRAAAEIALVYYDKAYAHYSSRQAPAEVVREEVRFGNLPLLARQWAVEQWAVEGC